MLKNIKLKPIIGQSVKDLELLSVTLGESKYRGMQLYDWVYRKRMDNLDKMLNLPISFRKKLAQYSFHPLKMVHKDISSSNRTKKYLFSLDDGKKIESVLMFEGKRVTVCLSTQVGCAVDCDFCATAKMGFSKNLNVGEIIDQFFLIQKKIEEKISNVVFMGMGEPFLNYSNSLAVAHLLNDSKGVNMAAWRITFSTAGVIKKINQFSNENQPFKLAVSLNGTDNNQRKKIMPITGKNPYNELIQASIKYTIKTRKKITFEYVILSGINDDVKDAIKLKKILEPIKCKLNIIPYNEIDNIYKRPSEQKIILFLNKLKDSKFPITVRWSKGQDINAGCGQLAIVKD